MRNSTLLYGRDLLWIASEMLEILTIIFRIIFNLCRVLRVIRGCLVASQEIFGGNLF